MKAGKISSRNAGNGRDSFKPYADAVRKPSGSDASLPMLDLPGSANDDEIAVPEHLFQTWLEVIQVYVERIYGAKMSQGITTDQENYDFAFPAVPARPVRVLPEDADDEESVKDAAYECDINKTVYMDNLKRYNDKNERIAEEASQIHGTILLQCTLRVKERLRKTQAGTDAERGNDPRELILALQACLCTNNREDLTEKLDAARHALRAMYHKRGESLMTMKKRLDGARSTLTKAVQSLAEQVCDAKVNPDLFDDDEAALALKAESRQQIYDDLLMEHVPSLATLTREILGTLDPKLHGGYREQVKRKQKDMPETLEDLVLQATEYGTGPAVSMVLNDTPGRAPQRTAALWTTQDQGGLGNNPRCSLCGGNGHTPQDCPYRAGGSKDRGRGGGGRGGQGGNGGRQGGQGGRGGDQGGRGRGRGRGGDHGGSGRGGQGGGNPSGDGLNSKERRAVEREKMVTQAVDGLSKGTIARPKSEGAGEQKSSK